MWRRSAPPLNRGSGESRPTRPVQASFGRGDEVEVAPTHRASLRKGPQRSARKPAPGSAGVGHIQLWRASRPQRQNTAIRPTITRRREGRWGRGRAQATNTVDTAAGSAVAAGPDGPPAPEAVHELNQVRRCAMGLLRPWLVRRRSCDGVARLRWGNECRRKGLQTFKSEGPRAL